MITRAFPNTPAVHRSISDGFALMEVTRLWKNMAAEGTAVSERKTKLMMTPSQRSISSNGFLAVPMRTSPTTIEDDNMTIIVSTHNLAVVIAYVEINQCVGCETWRKIVIFTQVIALMESNEAQRDASFAANRILTESWVPVRTSKLYGAFVLNRRVDLHAIDATPARWRGEIGSSPLDGASAVTSSPRN